MRPVLLLLLAAGFAYADDQGLLRCRGIGDPAARLACYDALPVPKPEARPPAAAPAAPGKPSAAPAGPAQTQEQFGFEQRRPNVQELDTIESYIPGRFEGWKPNMAIRLANGQVWQIADGSSRFLDLQNPKVVVRRAMLGSFFLEIEKDPRAPRVRRLQ